MQSKFAKGIAENVRLIAENTARVALLDQERGGDAWARAEARVEYVRAIDKAENNIAAFLQQPGAWPLPAVG